MAAVNFPNNPSNGDTFTSGNTVFTYDSSHTRWSGVTTVNGIQLNSLSVGAEPSASGDGDLSYNNTTGVFTYTPPDLSTMGASSDLLSFTANGAVSAGNLVVLNSAGTVSAVASSVAGQSTSQSQTSNLHYDDQSQTTWYDSVNEEHVFLKGGRYARITLDNGQQDATIEATGTITIGSSTTSNMQGCTIPGTSAGLALAVNTLYLVKNDGSTVSTSASVSLGTTTWETDDNNERLFCFDNGDAYLFLKKQGSDVIWALPINYHVANNTISLGTAVTTNLWETDWGNPMIVKDKHGVYWWFKNDIPDPSTAGSRELGYCNISSSSGVFSHTTKKTIALSGNGNGHASYNNNWDGENQMRYSAYTDMFMQTYQTANADIGFGAFKETTTGSGTLALKSRTDIETAPLDSGTWGQVVMIPSQTNTNVAFMWSRRLNSDGGWGQHFGTINSSGSWTETTVYKATPAYSDNNSGQTAKFTCLLEDAGGGFIRHSTGFHTLQNIKIHVPRMDTSTNAHNWIGIASTSVADTQSVEVHLSTGLSDEHTGLTVGSKYYAAADGTLTATETGSYGLVGEALSATTLQLVSEADLSSYATLISPSLVGAPTAPTVTAGNSSTKIATTAFVSDALTAADTISLTALKAEVAASADFAAFKTRIAAL